MSSDYQALVRPHISSMEAYTPILPYEVLSEQLGLPAEAIIKLDANENLYGPSPKALAALADLAAAAPIYPDPESRRLRAALADLGGAPAEHLLVGSGADELIDLIMRLFLSPGEALIDCPPTFGMYPFDGALNDARVISVPRRPDFSLDIEAVEAAARAHSPKLIFVTSPNNPDGGLLPPDHLERLLALPCIVVLDQAYAEFSAPLHHTFEQVQQVPGWPNLIVLRTFSKWAGLAGLRVGWGAFPLWMMEHLWKIKQPYNLNVAGEAAARASLEDLSWLEANLQKLRAERDRLSACLAGLGWLTPLPSQANFVLCRVEGIPVPQVKQSLRQAGILIRTYSKPGLSDCIRVSVGRPEHTDALINALERLTP